MSKNIFSNEAFAEWCERQGDRDFKYISGGSGCNGCAIEQYLTYCGLDVCGVGGVYYRLWANPSEDIPFPKDWEQAVIQYPSTFAEVAKALRAANAI